MNFYYMHLLKQITTNFPKELTARLHLITRAAFSLNSNERMFTHLRKPVIGAI